MKIKASSQINIELLGNFLTSIIPTTISQYFDIKITISHSFDIKHMISIIHFDTNSFCVGYTNMKFYKNKAAYTA